VNIQQAKKLIKILYKRQIETGVRFSVELESVPGIGKSESVEQVANELTKEMGSLVGFNPFFLSTLEQPDVRGYGLPDTDKDGTRIMTFTRAPWAPRIGMPSHGILFLDEFRQADHDVQKPAAELLLNGRVGDSKLPIEWMVVAASNGEKHRSGVQRELAFVSNRRMKITVEPDLNAWVEWAERAGIHWAAVAFAKVSPGDVFADTVPEKSGPFCTPRTLVKTSYLIDAMPMDLLTEAAAGYIGEGTAAKFIAFLRVAETIPDFNDIVKNPKKCPLPSSDRPDAQYATMQMIAHRIDKETAAPAFEYLKRMPKEFQVAGLKATLRRVPQLVQTTGFSTWLKENKDLLMSANTVNMD
jgi:hypothetical protein